MIIFDGGLLQDYGKWSGAALFYGGVARSEMEIRCRRELGVGDGVQERLWGLRGSLVKGAL